MDAPDPRDSVVRRLAAGVLDLIFSPVCLGCDGAIAPGDSARLVCRRCRTRLRPLPSPACDRCGAPRLRTGRPAEGTCAECDAWPAEMRVARSACLLHPPADRLVHQLKYRGWSGLAEPMGERMAGLRLPPDVEEDAPVVPVPTTRTRLRERGYNQAELLAAAFARRTGRRLVRALARASGASTQTTLQPVARGANVAGSFRLVDGAIRPVAGAEPILIDDVMTTGATASECVRTLLAAGARSVVVVTFARALDARRLTIQLAPEDHLLSE